ncbi:MAG: hypothetical protein LBQ32_00440 [Burkholderiaceae bacterium]|jgi:hypothetical protein|nr:hypothetical protein [Burkholderiaceae bacterium]
MKNFAFILCILFLVDIAAAGESIPQRVIKVENGIAHVDIVGDGTPGLIVSGHRENFNAHSFNVVSFYLQLDISGTKEWYIVPLMGNDKEEWSVTVGGGADCLLHDFRLLAKQGKEPPTLVLADRELGKSFATPASVKFSYYRLMHHPDGMPGFPPYAFELSRVVKAKANYCDVGDALKSELGIRQP